MIVAALALAAFAWQRDEPAACSTARVMGVRAPLFVLATARADTVRSGPGPVRYSSVPDGDSPGLATIHGQRFRLDRLGGDVPRDLASAAGAEAILVPYGSGCGEVWRWSESSRWTTPGKQIVVDASLRPRAQWVGGRPTFDVEPGHGAYPQAYEVWRDDDDDAPRMSAAQLFEMTRTLPTADEAERSPFAAYARLLRWARANPQLARHFPATNTLAEAHEALQPCVPAYDPHPVAGTYRVSVVLRRTDTLQTFFRTDAGGFPRCGEARPRFDLTAVSPRRAATAQLYVHGAAEPAGIPETNREAIAARDGCGVSTFEVRNQPRSAAPGERRWPADYNYLSLRRCFANTARVREIADSVFEAYKRDEKTDLVPGTFRETADGGATFEQAWGVGGRVLLEVRGTRIDRQTVAYD
jgi:hypothetical protein